MNELVLIVDKICPVSEIFENIENKILERKLLLEKEIEGKDYESYIAFLKEQCELDLKNKVLAFDMPALSYSRQTFDFIVNVLKACKTEKIKITGTLKLLDETLMPNEKTPSIMNGNDLQSLFELRERLKNLSIQENLKARELVSDNDCELESIAMANLVVDKMASEICKKQLSPFEAVLYTHKFCTQFFYTKSKDNYSSKVLGSIVEGGNIVCVGYSSLFKAILDKASLSGIEVKFNEIVDRKTQNSGGHANNLVIIDDPKYGIKGNYIVDTTWNSVNLESPANFSMCMTSIQDIAAWRRRKYFGLLDSAGAFFNDNLTFKPRKDRLDNRPRSQAIKEHNQFLKLSSPSIPLSKFEKGLFEICKAEGKSDEEAKIFVQESVYNSMIESRNFFVGKTSNCFFEETKKRRLFKPKEEFGKNEPKMEDFMVDGKFDELMYLIAKNEYIRLSREHDRKITKEKREQEKLFPDKNKKIFNNFIKE